MGIDFFFPSLSIIFVFVFPPGSKVCSHARSQLGFTVISKIRYRPKCFAENLLVSLNVPLNNMNFSIQN